MFLRDHNLIQDSPVPGPIDLHSNSDDRIKPGPIQNAVLSVNQHC